MFDYTFNEKLNIIFRWFFIGIFEEIEMECKRFVPIKRAFSDNGTKYYLMCAIHNRKFDFLIMKEEISAEDGEVLTNLDSDDEFSKAFLILFTKLLRNKEEQIKKLTESGGAYFSSAYTTSRWENVCLQLRLRNKRYGVVELVRSKSHFSASSVLVNSDICSAAFFLREEGTEDDEKEQAEAAASIALKESKSDIGIGIVHGGKGTTLCVNYGEQGLVTVHFSHDDTCAAAETIEQVSRMTVIKIGDLVEDFILHFRK